VNARVTKLKVERVYTADGILPNVAGDDTYEFGFQAIPLPPDLDPRWRVFDRAPDTKTGWMRVTPVEDDDAPAPERRRRSRGNSPECAHRPPRNNAPACFLLAVLCRLEAFRCFNTGCGLTTLEGPPSGGDRVPPVGLPAVEHA
jgi:hypothetical protein